MVQATLQWAVRWGCMGLIVVATVMQMVGMAVPCWLTEQAKPAGYPAFLTALRRQGIDPGLNASLPGATSLAEMHVGLWRWCLHVVTLGHDYNVCDTPDLGDFPAWWKGCQAMAVVGTLMGVLATICAGMEVYYTRRGVRFSGLAVLCAICCFVAAVGMGLSHGLFATRYLDNLMSIVHLPVARSAGLSTAYLPRMDWAFGLGAAAATLIGITGIILVAFVTRTYPAYQRTENVVV